MLICTLAGIPSSLLAAWAAAVIDVSLLRRAFGVFLLYIGIKEIFCKKPEPEAQEKTAG